MNRENGREAPKTPDSSSLASLTPAMIAAARQVVCKPLTDLEIRAMFLVMWSAWVDERRVR